MFLATAGGGGQKIIIRNLPFSTGEEKVRSAISEIPDIDNEAITQINIPKGQGEQKFDFISLLWGL